jgi:hypothetical protein
MTDYYILQLVKGTFNMIGQPVSTGKSIDTVFADTQIVVPESFLLADSTVSIDDQYLYLEVYLIPINGTPPSQWDTLSAFESQGLILALRADYLYEIVIPDNAQTSMAKRRAQKAHMPAKSKSALDILGQTLKGSASPFIVR